MDKFLSITLRIEEVTVTVTANKTTDAAATRSLVVDSSPWMQTLWDETRHAMLHMINESTNNGRK